MRFIDAVLLCGRQAGKQGDDFHAIWPVRITRILDVTLPQVFGQRAFSFADVALTGEENQDVAVIFSQ